SSLCEEDVRQALAGVAELTACPNLSDAVRAVQTSGARIALVDLAIDAELALRTMHELARAKPDLHLIALAARKDPDLILLAMRAHAREFVVSSELSELRRVIVDVGRTFAAPAAPAGTIVSVFPAKGGMGATALATNLAGELLTGGKRVALVDLDLQLGDV